jgi:hypothetical protein
VDVRPCLRPGSVRDYINTELFLLVHTYLVCKGLGVQFNNMAHQQALVGGQVLRTGANRSINKGTSAPVARIGCVGPVARQTNLASFEGLRPAIKSSKVMLLLHTKKFSRGCGVACKDVIYPCAGGTNGVAARESTKRISGS